jgi:IS30 family transposase
VLPDNISLLFLPSYALRRPKSTVLRELSRNKLPSGRYSPLHAAGAYQLRRRREALIEKDSALRTFVLDRLAEGWTPEQRRDVTNAMPAILDNLSWSFSPKLQEL